jgi:hypothetical protein
MKSKTLAAWLAFLGGPLGLHRFYLHGCGDWLGWLLPLPTPLGAYGVLRMASLGRNDAPELAAGPAAGLHRRGLLPHAPSSTACSKPEKWNARFNPGAARMRRRPHPLGDDLGHRAVADGRRRRAAWRASPSASSLLRDQVEEGRKISE